MASEIPGAGRRKVEKKLLSPTIEPVAEGVWVLRGGGPPKRTMNVYLLQDADGFTAFDGGIHGMAGAIKEAAKQLGGEVKRIVLGHAHEDHRGAAPDMGVPVLCHPDERRDAERELSAHDDRGFDDWGLIGLLGLLGLLPKKRHDVVVHDTTRPRNPNDPTHRT